MNILLIVIKNTAVLDFAVPLITRIKKDKPSANISVLYCTFSRKKILRKSRFYSNMMQESGIETYDFIDFLPHPFRSFRRVLRTLYSRSDWDTSSLKRMQSTAFGNRVAAFIQRSLGGLEGYLLGKIDMKSILPHFYPDIILFDNTSTTQFHGREYFFEYLYSAKKKLIMLPHAPHHSSTTAFTPFDEKGEKLPDWCEFWMPFKYDKSWASIPERKTQFSYIGYPGLDSEWLIRFSNRDQKKGKTLLKRPLNCLFIIRKFLPEGAVRGPGDDFVFDYDEFFGYLNLVKTALMKTGADIKLLVKPHPSNDYLSTADILQASGMPNWQITFEPIYDCLGVCDFVISLYSTILLVPAMAGIPVILLHSTAQDLAHQGHEIKQLYSGLSYYLEEPKDLIVKLPDVIKIARDRQAPGKAVWADDIRHLRDFYPDGATERALKRLALNN